MRDIVKAYPKFFGFSGAAVLVLVALLFLPPVSGADATTISKPITPNAATTVKLGNNDCRADHWPHVPTCEIAGRKIRVIKY